MQVLICNECGERFDEPFFQVAKSAGDVEHVHPECMIWEELNRHLLADPFKVSRVEIQVLVPNGYASRVATEMAPGT